MESPLLTASKRSTWGSSRGHWQLGANLSVAGWSVLAAVVFAAPLLVGSVHRPAVLLVPVLAGLGAALVLVGELSKNRFVRVTPAALLPFSLLLIPLVQSIPLPAAVVRRIDPAGDALLAGSSIADARLRPLSLDPPETRAIIAKAGGALAVFLVAFQLASGRTRRQLMVRVVAASTVAAIAIGLGHRILGENQIFGRFTESRGLLNGPFINANHMAEFLELGAFVCVASALAGASALNRVGWLATAAMAGACALGTFSRGAVLSLAAGIIVFVWLRHTALADTDERSGSGGAPRTMLWVTVMLILLAALAVGLGAEQLVSRLRDTQISHETRIGLWKDSLRVLAAHPFGIGRGAFERVFPAYRAVESGIEVRFSFIENEPLQYLVEMGWFGFLILMFGVAVLTKEWWASRRRDQIEAALVAGLVAVMVHNVVDFGLETLGVQLPFAAILGTLLGRARDASERTVSRGLGVGAWSAALVAIAIGAISVARPASANFDALLEMATPGAPKREIARRAQIAHPVDYFYVLAQAATEPTSPDSSGRSPRLHLLNRALLLCPRCPDVHGAVASTLWSLGKRGQALEEWRTAVEMRPVVFDPILQSVWTAGATPDEIAVIAGADADRLTRAAAFLVSRGQAKGARVLLPLIGSAGGSDEEVLLLKASLDINAGATDEALKSLDAARKLAPKTPRVYLLLSEAKVKAGRVEEALRDLDTGIGMNPHDLSLLRSRLSIIMTHHKWFLAKNALEALEIALAEARMPTTEVHLASARYYSTLREYGKASAEYSLVLAQEPGNSGTWAELGGLWESAGRIAPALEAYRQSNAIAPGNAGVVAAIQRLTHQIETIRAGSALMP